jgi:G:T-mismatch repair DNA endonuclease (very short patch repair protein)
MKKFEQNVKSHEKATGELKDQGWRGFVIWECELSRLDSLGRKLSNLLCEN